MDYRATVRSADGRQTVVRVRHSDRRGAAKELGLSPSRVLKVTPDWLGTFLRKDLSGGPAKAEQAILLENVAAQLGTNASVEQIFTGYLENDKTFKLDQSKQARAYEIEDYLEALNFDKNVVLLARAGREAGEPAQALRDAAQHLLDEEDRKGAVSKHLRSGFFYGGLALSALVAGPLGFGSQLTNIESKLRMELNYNAATTILRSLESFYQNYWVVIVGIIVAIYFFRQQIFDHVRGLPLFSMVDRLIRVRRGIDFLSAFLLLRRGNKTAVQALEIMVADAKKGDVLILNRVLDIIRRGDPLTKALQKKDWSPAVLSGTSLFNEVSVEDIVRIGEGILRSQRRELSKVAEKLATTIQAIGMFSLVTMLLICVVGFLLPIMSIRAQGM